MASNKPKTGTSSDAQDDLNALLREALPPQGAWSEEEYLWLTDRLRRPIEFTDGRIEPMPMPNYGHQILLLFLYRTFYSYFQQAQRRGVVVTSGLRMRAAGEFPGTRHPLAMRPVRFASPGPLLARRRPRGRNRQP